MWLSSYSRDYMCAYMDRSYMMIRTSQLKGSLCTLLPWSSPLSDDSIFQHLHPSWDDANPYTPKITPRFYWWASFDRNDIYRTRWNPSHFWRKCIKTGTKLRVLYASGHIKNLAVSRNLPVRTLSTAKVWESSRCNVIFLHDVTLNRSCPGGARICPSQTSNFSANARSRKGNFLIGSPNLRMDVV